jgi:hypothetical protein
MELSSYPDNLFMKLLLQRLIVLSSILFSFSACNKVDTQAPEETTLDSTLVVPQSVLVVPVNYHVSGLETMINKKISGTVIKKWMVVGDKGDSVYLEVSKVQDIKVRRSNKTFFYDVPVIVSGKYITRIAGIKISNATPVRANIILKIASTFHLGPKWDLIPESKIVDIVWVEEPTIKVFGLKINLRGPIEKILQHKENDLLLKADEAIIHLINTRKIVNKLWMDIQKPIVINRKKKIVYLKPYCTEMTGRLLETEPDLISMQFELKANVHTYIEGDSIPASNPVLNDFRRKDNENDSLIVYVHSSVKFETLNEILNNELAGKKIEKKGLDVTIKKLRVYGTDSGIAVQLDVKGAINGSLYAIGSIKFDSTSKVVEVQDLNFVLNTENVLAKSADWFLHSEVLDLISGKLSFNTEVLADKLPQIIMKAVEKGKTGQKIDINMGHLDVWPQKILVTKNDLQLLVKASGKGNVDLEQKLFEGKKKKK